MDFGERRLTVADSQVVPDGSAAVVQHDGKPMASVPQWLSKSAHVWVQCPDVEKAWKSLNRHTKDVLAAGGLLTNEQGALLCIHRLGHWDLPKGKVERGEDLPTAAAREVHEECGVPLPIVGAPFAKTFHVYGRKDDKMKVTQWYAWPQVLDQKTCSFNPKLRKASPKSGGPCPKKWPKWNQTPLATLPGS